MGRLIEELSWRQSWLIISGVLYLQNVKYVQQYSKKVQEVRKDSSWRSNIT